MERYTYRIPTMKLSSIFIGLVAVQALHSVEEYVGRLYDVFPPARFLSGLISSDLRRGFVIFNVALVLFGVWCYLWPIRRRWRSATAVAWFWVTIELINGIGHPLWSLREHAYTPGVVTAPLLLALAIALASRLLPQASAEIGLERKTGPRSGAPLDGNIK
jgi:Protein of unknown function with HXXEE motif